jgi:hypothetical protein
MAENEYGRRKNDEWTCKYIDTRICELEKRLIVMLEARDLALKLSATSLQRQLEAMNEFRSQIKDERIHLMPRSEFAIQHERVLEDIRQLRESKAMLEGKASQSSVTFTMIIAIVGIGISLIALFLH